MKKKVLVDKENDTFQLARKKEKKKDEMKDNIQPDSIIDITDHEEKIIEKIKKIIYEIYPEMQNVEPTLIDEDIEKVADNVLNTLKKMQTVKLNYGKMERAWKSLVFEKEIKIEEVQLIRQVIATINRSGIIMRIDTNY